MNKVLKNKILTLQSKSFHDVDHLTILHMLYDEFKNGNKQLYQLSKYFINGMDDIPTLQQKELWNSDSFEKRRKLFYDNHDELINIIKEYYDLYNSEVLKQTFHSNGSLKCIWIERANKIHGVFRRYHENTVLAYEANYEEGKYSGQVKEWNENGQIIEIGFYKGEDYIVEQFWDQNGTQLLKDGTGKVIRYYGTDDHTIYVEYFKEYVFIDEKKIKGVSFGKFEPE